MLTDMDNGIPQWVPSKSFQVQTQYYSMPITGTFLFRTLDFLASLTVVQQIFWKTWLKYGCLPLYYLSVQSDMVGRAIRRTSRAWARSLPTSGKIEIPSVRNISHCLNLSTSISKT